MKKVTYSKINLNCVFQHNEGIEETKCLNGIISRTGQGSFRFEEAIRKGQNPRNPKLYDGRYLSMVRKSNGKYQFHMKSLPETFDREKLPFAIFTEVTAALQIIS